MWLVTRLAAIRFRQFLAFEDDLCFGGGDAVCRPFDDLNDLVGIHSIRSYVFLMMPRVVQEVHMHMFRGIAYPTVAEAEYDFIVQAGGCARGQVLQEVNKAVGLAETRT